MKRCSRCQLQKPLADFHRDHGKKDGCASRCKTCACEATRAHYRTKRRDVLMAQRRTRRSKRRGSGYVRGVRKRCSRCRRLRAWGDFYAESRAIDGKRSACKACLLRAQRSRWPAMRKRENRRRTQRARTNRAAEARRVGDWHQANPERVREHKRNSRARRRKRNPLRVNGPTRAYRARKHNAPGSHTPEQAQARSELYGHRCWICRADATALDHVKPLTRGGRDYPANLRPICHPCNARKNNIWPLPNQWPWRW